MKKDELNETTVSQFNYNQHYRQFISEKLFVTFTTKFVYIVLLNKTMLKIYIQENEKNINYIKYKTIEYILNINI